LDALAAGYPEKTQRVLEKKNIEKKGFKKEPLLLPPKILRN